VGFEYWKAVYSAEMTMPQTNIHSVLMNTFNAVHTENNNFVQFCNCL